MNHQELLEWIGAFLIVALAAAVITFTWCKTIDGYLWVIKRMQGTAGESA